MALGIVLALFAVYALVVTVQMRRAISAEDPVARLREARRLLIAVAVGVPLVGALIIVAI